MVNKNNKNEDCKLYKEKIQIEYAREEKCNVHRGRRRWSLEESRDWRKKRRRSTAEGVEAGRRKEEEVVIGVYFHYHS